MEDILRPKSEEDIKKYFSKIPEKERLKYIVNAALGDVDIYGKENEIQVETEGPDNTNIVIEILYENGKYEVDWRAEDLDHYNYYDFAGDIKTCNSLIELFVYLNQINGLVNDEYNKYEDSDEYNEGREDMEEFLK